ncbi:hypothetical protein [Actinomadura sp. HBU206391]|uniref:hypothetical protein n=1 Tax=Actinomadura sp. HBU206391 TaxID=2731692 RepID=UPI00164FB815|nr:hypothetical protein [Actinomadura sp. HBU206391]MBC6460326.1 hypothetical protein [Actinomadura sp. HBU206391]
MTDPEEHWHGFSPAVGTGSPDVRRAGDLAFAGPPPGPQWPGREPSKEELHGVPSTDTVARSPLGVGVSTTRRPEQIAREEGEQRPTVGFRGRARRPFGRSEPEEGGMASSEPISEESPYLHPSG